MGDETTIEGVTDPSSEDPKFFQEVTSGPIQRAATVRLLSKPEIQELFADADDVKVDYAVRTVDNGSSKVQYWMVNAIFAKLALFLHMLTLDVVEFLGLELLDFELMAAIPQLA